MDNSQAQNNQTPGSRSQHPTPQPQVRNPQQPVNRPTQANTQASAPIQQHNQSAQPAVDKDTLWYLDNYLLLRDYYDRTISRIAARCIRMGNIAMEEYPHYPYILDVLEEISEVGNFVIKHKELHPYVERKIKGGLEALKRNLKEYETELQKNSSPDMIKEDASELSKMKDALGSIDIKDDPTQGAGMNMDDLMNKLMKQNQIDTGEYETHDENSQAPELEQPIAPRGI